MRGPAQASEGKENTAGHKGLGQAAGGRKATPAPGGARMAEPDQRGRARERQDGATERSPEAPPAACPEPAPQWANRAQPIP